MISLFSDHVTRPMLEDALTEFVGEIFQKPPAYSALKIKGRRASDIARFDDLLLQQSLNLK